MKCTAAVVATRGAALTIEQFDKKAGNAIMELVGGRAIHPVNVRVGGFYRAPARPEMTALAESCASRWTRHWQHAIDRGTPRSTGGLTFAPAEFEEHVIEEHVPHSTALHARLAGRGRYLTGPAARAVPCRRAAAGRHGAWCGWISTISS